MTSDTDTDETSGTDWATSDIIVPAALCLVHKNEYPERTYLVNVLMRTPCVTNYNCGGPGVSPESPMASDSAPGEDSIVGIPWG